MIILLSKNMYESTLIKAGLTQKQAKIYFACLELGAAKAPEIARKADLKRTTVYGILDELVNMGVISPSIRGKLKLFRAETPDTLLEILENRKRELESVLPELNKMFSNQHFRPHMQFFEGKEGVKRIYDDTLRCRQKKIRQIIRVKDFLEFPGGDYATEYIKKRVARGIETYALHPKSGDIANETFGTNSEKLKRHVRYLPPNAFYASMIVIYDNKVAMVSTKKENFGFIIESQEFSNTLIAYFQFMWGLGSNEPE